MSVYFTGDKMLSKTNPLTTFDIRKLMYRQSNAFSLNFVYCIFFILMLILYLASGFVPLFLSHFYFCKDIIRHQIEPKWMPNGYF